MPRPLSSIPGRLRLSGVDRAAMAAEAIDGALVWRRLEVLHLPQPLIDHPMHHGHLAGGALGPLRIAREIFLDVTVRAANPESLAVTEVHDEQKTLCRDVLEPVEPDVLEDLSCRLALLAPDPLHDLSLMPVIDLLIRRFSRRCGGSGLLDWGGCAHLRGRSGGTGRDRQKHEERCHVVHGSSLTVALNRQTKANQAPMEANVEN